MENWAYNNASSKNYTKNSCFPHYTNPDGSVMKKMHMKDLFEQLAGTSTGSILSAALSLPKEPGSK